MQTEGDGSTNVRRRVSAVFNFQLKQINIPYKMWADRVCDAIKLLHLQVGRGDCCPLSLYAAARCQRSLKPRVTWPESAPPPLLEFLTAYRQLSVRISPHHRLKPARSSNCSRRFFCCRLLINPWTERRCCAVWVSPSTHGNKTAVAGCIGAFQPSMAVKGCHCASFLPITNAHLHLS